MAIIYTKHLRKRIIERRFPYKYPRLIYRQSKDKYYDSLEGSLNAVLDLKYNRKIRKINIAFHEDKGNVIIRTIHIIGSIQITNRVKAGRWTKL